MGSISYILGYIKRWVYAVGAALLAGGALFWVGQYKGSSNAKQKAQAGDQKKARKLQDKADEARRKANTTTRSATDRLRDRGKLRD